MKYFNVSIKSKTYNLCSTADALAHDADQATELCGTKFHKDVNGFLRSAHERRRESTPYKEIPKEVLLRGADITVRVISEEPMVIVSTWNKIT